MELGAQEITELVEKAAEYGVEMDLPKTKTGVKKRADSQNWATRTIKGKGGRNGLKTLYTLPIEIIEQLKQKGLLHLIQDAASLVAVSNTPIPHTVGDVSPSMQSAVSQYRVWANEQDRYSIVPIRYYRHVHASAGVGTQVWDTDCDVIWFRSSFISYLGVNPATIFCTRIKGDSMFSTLIGSGTVLWQACTQYINEGIYLIRQFNEIRAKRLVRLSRDTYNIISDNPNKAIYPTEILDLKAYEPHEFEIYGRYLWDCAIRDRQMIEPLQIP